MLGLLLMALAVVGAPPRPPVPYTPPGTTILKNQGTTLGVVTTINCGTALSCSRTDAGIGTITGQVGDGGFSLPLVVVRLPLLNDGGNISCLPAGTGDAGCVTEAAQNFSGAKTFLSSLRIGSAGSPVEGVDDYGALHVAGDLTQAGGTYIEGAYFWYSPTYAGPSGTDTPGFVFTGGLSPGDIYKSYEFRAKEIVFGFSNTTYPRERARLTEAGVLKLNALSGGDALELLNGAHLNLSTADSNAYLYRSAADTISTPGTLLAANLTGTNTGDQTKTCGAGSFVTTLAAGTGSTCTTESYVGTVTDVTGVAPVASSGGTTPAISMPAAGANQAGYLNSVGGRLVIDAGLVDTSNVASSFAGALTASNLSGTNTGDVTIGTANGLSLAGQALSLATAVAGGANGALLGTDKTKLDNTTNTNSGDVTIGTANGLSLSGQAISLATAIAGGVNGALLGTDKTKLDATSGTNSGDQTKTCGAGSGVTTLAAGTGSTCAAFAGGTGTANGTNTGDQTISLTGGVTGSGTGSFAATVITNANLTGPVTSVGNATTIGAGQVSDANLANNYSGVGTCTNQFARVLNDNAAPTCAAVAIADHSATGTPSATTYLRGDNTWSTPTSGAGNFGTFTVTFGNSGLSTYDSAVATISPAAWVLASSAILLTPACSITVDNTAETCWLSGLQCSVTAITAATSFKAVCVSQIQASGSYTVSYTGS